MICRRSGRKSTPAGSDTREEAPVATGIQPAAWVGRVSMLAGFAGIAAFAVLSTRVGMVQAVAVEDDALTCPEMADCSGLPAFSQKSPHAHASPIVNGVHEGPRPDAVNILQQSYREVFKTGNRNAAAHLWSTFLLNQSSTMQVANFENLWTAFCGISASLIVPINADSRWRLTLRDVNGVMQTGFMYYCTGCRGWPCLCDSLEHLRVDTKTVTLADGSTKQYKFAVIGNPCATPALAEKLHSPIRDPSFGNREIRLQQAAPELTCAGSILQKATLSDHGHVIVAMFFEDVPTLPSHDEEEFAERCRRRGEQVGMGPIFRTLASVNQL